MLIFLIPFSSVAQFKTNPSYPKDFFRNPLNIPISLAGNFGELRPNHYHMGLDLKTDRRENLPVHASGDGYISRIKVESYGFGRAVYITHPNGFTTLYAHLNDFMPALEAWVKEQQYEAQSWAIYRELPPGKFPVKKGDLIAYSGNTGGSMGPHLHFEFRRTADDVNLNGMFFGLPLADNTKPNLVRLALYDRTKSTYEQAPRLLALTARGNGDFSTPAQKVSTPRVSFAITAYDTHSGSTNLNGIHEAVLYDNDKAVIGFRMNEISYSDTRYLNAHIDYKTKANGGAYLQHLSELPGYENSIYTKFAGDGALDISDGREHRIRIEVKDAYGNTSVANTTVTYDGKPVQFTAPAGQRFYPGMMGVFESPECEFILGEHALYDSVSVAYSQQPTSLPQVVSGCHGNESHEDSLLVRIKLTKGLTAELIPRVVMQRFIGTKKEVMPVSWTSGWATGRFRDFGSFQLVLDTLAPVVKTIGWSDGADLSNAGRIVFTVDDNLDEWRVTRTLLDGRWIRFANDKAKNFIYKFDELCGPGDHQLLVIAFDVAGNRVEKLLRFSR
ncbi:MAG: M23 family metallopeptidase [Flavihumibacter sp.]